MRRKKRQEANNTPEKSKIFRRANEGTVTTLKLRATKECMDRKKAWAYYVTESLKILRHVNIVGEQGGVFFFFLFF